MRVIPALPSMLDTKSKEQCRSSCYVVEKYNFALNSTTRAIVNIDKKEVVAINTMIICNQILVIG